MKDPHSSLKQTEAAEAKLIYNQNHHKAYINVMGCLAMELVLLLRFCDGNNVFDVSRCSMKHCNR